MQVFYIIKIWMTFCQKVFPLKSGSAFLLEKSFNDYVWFSYDLL